MRMGEYLAGLAIGLFLCLVFGVLAVFLFGWFGIVLGFLAVVFWSVRIVLVAINDQNKRMEDMIKIMIDILLNSQQTKESE